MPSFFTPDRHGYAVKFSKSAPDRLLVASSRCFGLAGAGTLFVLDINEDEDGLVETKKFEWSDGLFDVVCSENNPNIVVTVSGDGTMQLWNLESIKDESPLNNFPQMIYKEHRKEIYSIDWMSVRSESFMLTASWDCSIKLWDPNSTTSLCTYMSHSKLIYDVSFSPLIPNTFASVSADGFLKIWNIFNKDRPVACLQSESEILSVDWCKFDQNILATGSADGCVRGYDVRYFGVPTFELKGHDFAVRKIAFSPFDISTIASVGFDNYTRIWDFNKTTQPLESFQHHTDFAYGIDWNPNKRNQIADCGWDSMINVFQSNIT